IARKVPVLLKAPVMEINVDDVESLGRLAAEVGAEWTLDAKVTAMETGDQAPTALRMKAATLAAFYRGPMGAYLGQTYATGTPAAIAAGGDPEALRPLHHTPCRAGQQSVAITPTGDVWPCNALPLPCGNLR